jgi:hypothetical protein
MKYKIWLVSLLLLSAVVAKAQADSQFLTRLSDSAQLEITKINTMPGYQSSYLIMMTQPVDHDDEQAGYFKQRIWLNHLDEKAPVVMVTEGYSAPSNYLTEIAKELKANQIIVEHRYFLASTPVNKDWKYLTVKNAAADHHAIISLFKKVYRAKWLTTGISKGGQTTIFHRALYPKDVDVSVPYVAPINQDREDPRLLAFFEQVGSDADRQKVKDFQRLVLTRKERLLPLFIERAKFYHWDFSMGYERAFELAVLEYPFAFWQWGIAVDEIPGEMSSDEEIMNHYITAASPNYFSDQDRQKYEPFFYQAYKELGYYNYVPGDLKPLMNSVKQDTISSSFFAPGGDTLAFNTNTIPLVVNRLRRYNPKMILIYGEYDPWGATSLDITGMKHAMKVVKPQGSHRARINNLSEAKKEEVWSLLKKWMKVK